MDREFSKVKFWVFLPIALLLTGVSLLLLNMVMDLGSNFIFRVSQDASLVFSDSFYFALLLINLFLAPISLIMIWYKFSREAFSSSLFWGLLPPLVFFSSTLAVDLLLL